MTTPPDLNNLNANQLRQLAAQLLTESAEKEKRLHNQQLLNDKLKHELAILKRHHFGKSSEVLNVHQASLLDELVDADIAAVEAALARPSEPTHQAVKRQPKRSSLPPELPRKVIEHEPECTRCDCGCQLQRIGEDISEKLDYTPNTFTVERHIRFYCWLLRTVAGSCELSRTSPSPHFGSVANFSFARNTPMAWTQLSCERHELLIGGGTLLVQLPFANQMGSFDTINCGLS
ncbi:IS66 family transposase zinc-finger binding domain-containing protein [Microbulbifer sp. 2205BS26-8]|uniref:IS66 family transposase n=1 Tax=Microbulbifer sp. 2205BS26-8 TaxID=3064386 RepID=UPI00273D8987|nr:IS66 family transposase zinc-finger binding domain-containing protein [Microbulbifer sp. 2205BS26-8]MDP5211005.1 IS66 family transposase zinc-finger binding domain-containing protein [Microbulbifer sp. 2205BS26-8]